MIGKMPKLSPVQQKFILHWGEMGIKWGINRTVAQIHALLFMSQKPLNAEDIVQVLGNARPSPELRGGSAENREDLGQGVAAVKPLSFNAGKGGAFTVVSFHR